MYRVLKSAPTGRAIRKRAEAFVEPVILKGQILNACLSDAV
jgi:hypothetical protein